MILLLGAFVAQAGGLDLLEVGGAYGTPAATGPTATWWNPAGLAAGSGTRYHIEGAPTFATVNIQRADPGYASTPGLYGPETADYGGTARYTGGSVVPFAGVATDFGQPGLGVGISVAVPHARGAGGARDQVTRYHLVQGGNQALYAQVAGAYEVKERFAFGVTGAFVLSEYQSDLYTEAVTSLNDGLKESFGQTGDYFSDTAIEDERYATNAATTAPLKDNAITFGLGARLQASERVVLSLAYRHGFRVDNEGSNRLVFSCPPTEHTTARAGAELSGLCYADLPGRQTVGYDLPARVHGSVLWEPIGTLKLELMGGWVGWSVYQDLDITIQVDPADVTLAADEATAADTAAKVSQVKQWARDGQDSFWFALDAKVLATERAEIGGRVLYDKGAIPTHALGPNNYDADTVWISGSVLGHLDEKLSLGFSAGTALAATRVVTNSAFGITVDPAERRSGRYFYTSTNGTYASNITRLGLFVRGRFAHGAKR